MALFYRRLIKRELDFLRPKILRPDRERDVLGKLNSHSRQALEMEWEVVIVAALARLADVTYEQPFGARNPDIFLQQESTNNHFELMADIVTVSDSNSQKENPADFFFQEFGRISRKAGLCGGFDIRIGEGTIGKYRDAKTRLLLPPKGEIPKFIRNELTPFLREITAQPSIPRPFEYNQSGIQIRIIYDPKQTNYTTGGYALCATPNPLSRALNDKATQLRETGYDGLLGIIVTDGGCHVLASRNSNPGAFSPDKLIEQFLETHPRIAFVTTSHHETWGYSRVEHRLSHKIHFQRRLLPDIKSNLYALFDSGLRDLPPVASSPKNAWLDIRNKKEISRGCNLGAYNWTPCRKLTVSSRTLVALLAGTLTTTDFKLLFNAPSRPEGAPLIQFFRHVAQSHVSIARASVDRRLAEDDDWVTFDIGTLPMGPPTHKDSAIEHSCGLSVTVLARYFAGLDYNLASGKTHYSYLATIPDDIRGFLRQMEGEGRMLVDTQLDHDAGQIRLVFGDRDSAISQYF